MLLTQKLFGYLHRIFNQDPKPFLAMRLQYAGGMTWNVTDGVLTTTVSGGPGQSLTVNLADYTLYGLVDYFAGQAGYDVVYADQTELAHLSALVLLDGAGDIAQDNGDHLYAYTSLLYALMEANAIELDDARAQIAAMLQQMVVQTATGEFLDDLGNRFGVPRQVNEADSDYGPRILNEVMRPRGNNVALAEDISNLTGQPVTVDDYSYYGNPPYEYNSQYTFNGALNYQQPVIPIYGLFDVTYGYDLESGQDPTTYAQTVADLVNKYRDAGTHLHTLKLSGSVLMDAFTAPTDGGAIPWALTMPLSDTFTAPVDGALGMALALAAMSDSFTAPTESASLSVSYSTTFNGLRNYNGQVPYGSGQTFTETLA